MGSGYDRQAFKATVRSILDMVAEDHTLGGTAYDSAVEVAHMGSGGQVREGGMSRQVRTNQEHLVDWADIAIVGKRVTPYDKVSVA